MLYFVKNYSLRTRHSHILLAEIVVAKKQKYTKLIFCLCCKGLRTAYSFRTCSIKKRDVGHLMTLRGYMLQPGLKFTSLLISFLAGLQAQTSSSLREVSIVTLSLSGQIRD
jgi:hypothetical protein